MDPTKKESPVPLAALLSETAASDRNYALGALYNRKKRSVRFRLWAPTVQAAEVNLYRESHTASPDWRIAMNYDRITGFWTADFAQTDPDGLSYDYTLYNEGYTRTVLDPYARSMESFRNDGSAGRGAVVDMQSPRSQPQGAGKHSFYPLKRREDAVIYEISIRDFTIHSTSRTRARPGTYAAFIEKLPYLKKLGITHIQLMPVLKSYNIDETRQDYENADTVIGANYNWGYDPHNYFTPSGWFSANPEDPYARIRELRELIRACHKAGMGVLLDVVYNHMAETRFLDDIVPGYYFRTREGRFTSDSGCGNDTASERAMMKRLIIDSVCHWTREYGADGFRFDLMGLIDASAVIAAYDAARSVNPHTLFVGEGWKMYSGCETVCLDQNCMTTVDSAAVFNDEFRDLLRAGGLNEEGRGFITGKETDISRLYMNMLGSPQQNYTAAWPANNLQYITAHDGLTLRDCIAHNCRLSGCTDANQEEIARRMQLGIFAVLASQGIAFLHGGEELGRTKPNPNGSGQDCIGNFVRNSYRSPDSINALIWQPGKIYGRLFAYTAGMIALRRRNGVFRMGSAEQITKSARLLSHERENDLFIVYSLERENDIWYIAINADTDARIIALPESIEGAAVFADRRRAGIRPIRFPDGVRIRKNILEIASLTAAVICRKAAAKA